MLLIALLALAVASALGGCAGTVARRDLTAAERRADLAYLATVFAEREQSFTPATRAVFEARVAALEVRVAAMTHDEFLIGVQWAVAAADNGHTEALTHEHQRLRLPIDLEWFADGLFVVAARPGYEDLLGAAVASVDGQSPKELLATLDAYSPGTAEHARVLGGHFLERPELLAVLRRAAAPEALTIAFALPGGRAVTRRVPGLPGESTARAADARHVLDGVEPLPLYLRQPETAAFTDWLPELGALYLRINSNADKTLPRALERVLAEIKARGPQTVIVDLRLNGGGNYELTAPFAEGLAAWLRADGRLVLILGNRTFSAAIVTAAILKARAGEHTLVVGERPGDGLRFWSEGGFLVLPNSGLRVHYSDGYHDWRAGYDAADPRYGSNLRIARVNARFSAAAGDLEPDLRIPLTFADYAAGRDPVMARLRSVLRDGS